VSVAVAIIASRVPGRLVVKARLRGGFWKKFEIEKIAGNWQPQAPFTATLNAVEASH